MIKKKMMIGLTVTTMLMTMLTGCGGSVPANSVHSIDDLAKKAIGVQLGTTGDIYATDEAKKNGATVERYNKGTDAVQALKQGKIDCVIIDSEPAKVFVSKNSDLSILDEPFSEEEYAICLNKENGELKEKINTVLNELKEEGTIQSIIDNYIGENAGKTPYAKAEGEHPNGTLTMATNAEFPPYEYKEGDSIKGIDVDVAQAICDKLGMELKVEDMAFDSIITAVQSGKADMGLAGITVTEERKESIDFTDTYTKAKQVIIVRSK